MLIKSLNLGIRILKTIRLSQGPYCDINRLAIGLPVLIALVMGTLGAAVFAEAQQLQESSPFVIQDGLQQQQQPLQQQQQQTLPQPQTQLPQGMIADLAKPGVVQVASYYYAQLSAYTWNFNDQLMGQDLESLVDDDVLDPDDPAAVEGARISLFLENPAAYMLPVDSFMQTEVEISATGSGFIVTPDGYIVTNAHVVVPPEEEIQYAIFDQAVYNFIETDLEEIGIQFQTQEQYDAVVEALYQFYWSEPAQMTIDSSSSSVYVLARYAIPGPVIQTGEQEIPAEVITHATGQPVPGKDVAIIKIEAANLPTLPLGDDMTLQSLDSLIVVGFPGAVSTNPILSPTGQEPTVLTGQFNGYQRTIGGWNAMHVQAPIGHGNSGGPALDSSGRVVGIATFGSIDPTTGQEASGFNYLVPVSIVKDFLSRANIQPSDSQFTTMYRQALSEYAVGNYQQALNILQQLNGLSPNNSYVINYLTRAQQAAGVPNTVAPLSNTTSNFS